MSLLSRRLLIKSILKSDSLIQPGPWLDLTYGATLTPYSYIQCMLVAHKNLGRIVEQTNQEYHLWYTGIELNEAN